MNLTRNSHGLHLPLRRLTRKVTGIISEMNYAQRRLFSLRTRGVLQHEP